MHHLTVSALVSLPSTLWHYLLHELEYHPIHVAFDFIMLAFVFYFLRMPVHKANVPAPEKPTKEEEEMLIAEFKSEPFSVPQRPELPEAPVVSQYNGVMATLEGGRQVVNVATFDFLSYATATCVVETAQDTIVKYGCGSCGPRGFYGTIKPHLDLESRLAQFTGTEACIIYSFSFATISTLIPCFTARGDDVLVDEDCNLAIQIGARLSRSNVTYFKHNDLGHLETLMQQSHTRQKQKGKRTPPRRTVILEGLYRSTGELARLPEIVALAKKYKFRVMLDDTMGFAAIGVTGRGTPQHFGVPISDIDFYIGAMSTSLGSVGGFCCGTAPMVDHQRLGATGYVFSASLPPYASAAAATVLDCIDEDPSRVVNLQKNAAAFRKLFADAGSLPAGIEVLGGGAADRSLCSPVVHFGLKGPAPANVDGSRLQFARAAEGMLRDGFLAVATKENDQDRSAARPSLRVSIKSQLSEQQVRDLAASVRKNLKLQFA